LIELSPSSYYYRPTAKQKENALVVERLTVLRQIFRGYGYRRMTIQLQRDGLRINHKRVLDLMRQSGLLCQTKRAFVRTTDSGHSLTIAPNLYRNQVPVAPNRIWIADLTYIRLLRQFVYLAVILDAFSRRVIGWALSQRLDDELTLSALKCALHLRRPQPGCLHHSDRGGQYASSNYTALLTRHGFQISMSRKGNPYDNATLESFNATLKTEEVYMANYRTLEEARNQLPYFIENVYNQKRMHSALEYLSPVEFELNYYQTLKTPLNPP
jgi:putative transposase